MSRTRRLATVLLIVVLGVLAIRLPMAAAERAGDYAVFDPVVDVYALVKRQFYKEPDPSELQRGAISGMLETLDDPYTEFIPAENTADFDKEILGEYVGIGAGVRGQDGFLLIISPLDGSPALRAGVQANDLVVGVEGESVYNVPADAIVDRLLGKPGEPVTITIEREGTEKDLPPGAKPPSVAGPVGEAPGPRAGCIRFDLTIVREKIVTSTVQGVHREGDRWSFWVDPAKKIALVRVSQFTGSTVPDLRDVLDRLVKENMAALILDLRFNGGGSLNAAIEMSDMFLSEGVIVSTRGRAVQEQKYYARAEGTLPDFPMIVLVNQDSASASEIVAGALSDNRRAVVLGTRTFGKGIVQAVYRLPSGAGQLKITEQYYFLPSGRCIHRNDDSTEWGVDPTDGFYLPMTLDEMRDMFRVRREEEIIRAQPQSEEDRQNWSDPAWILDHAKDKQLAAAVEAARARIETGEWKPTGEPAPKGAPELAALRAEEERYDLLLRELGRSQRRIAALSASSAGAPHPHEQDLIPGESDLTGGRLAVYDAQGNEVATLSITGPDLEEWLIGAPVRAERSPSENGAAAHP